MRTGTKVAVDDSPLPLRGSRRRELSVARFATDYIRVPRGHGVRKPLRLRPWQRALVAVVATDERQAGIVHRVASRMVELHPDLEGRVQQYADALTVPGRGSSFQVLPAVPKRLEGLDYTLAIVDEAGRVDQEVYEVISLATGKQRRQSCWPSGRPGPSSTRP